MTVLLHVSYIIKAIDHKRYGLFST
jgi:hypothetical protein